MKVLVSICCLTYQHEKYISQAIEGFLSQKTNFSFEILIHDDASTDSTAEIVKEYEKKYPNIIKPIYQKENQYSKGVSLSAKYQFPRAKGKYIALCEGDDYWTDPYKLQKQVDVMEKNERCSMCFHSAFILDSKMMNNLDINNLAKPNSLRRLQTSKGGFFFEGGSGAPTASILFRSKLLEDIPNFFYKSPVGDMPLKLILSYLGDIIYIDEPMSVRRKGISGSWNDIIYNSLTKEKEYLLGMIKMLESYNAYSKERNNSLVKTKIGNYKKRLENTEIKILISRLKRILKNKNFAEKVLFLMKFLLKLIIEKIK